MDQKHIKIFSDISLVAKRLQSLLNNQGIHSIIKDNVESARLGGFGNLPSSVDVYVLNTDIEVAAPIIENFQKEISE